MEGDGWHETQTVYTSSGSNRRRKSEKCLLLSLPFVANVHRLYLSCAHFVLDLLLLHKPQIHAVVRNAELC